MKFYETSALDSSNIKHAFEELIMDIYNKNRNNFDSDNFKNYSFELGINKQNNSEIKEDDSLCGCI